MEAAAAAELRGAPSRHRRKTGPASNPAAQYRSAPAVRSHHDMGWTRCSSRAADGLADGVRDRAGSDVDVRSCCERCHEVKAYTRDGARKSGDQRAGWSDNTGVGAALPGARCHPIRPRIHHASRCSMHTHHDQPACSEPVTNTSGSSLRLVVRRHCQSILWPPSACRRHYEYHLTPANAQPFSALRPRKGARAFWPQATGRSPTNGSRYVPPPPTPHALPGKPSPPQ